MSNFTMQTTFEARQKRAARLQEDKECLSAAQRLYNREKMIKTTVAAIITFSVIFTIAMVI